MSVNNTTDQGPEVSLIVLTWNSADYIQHCISSYAESLSNQGVAAEFIIIDNGSTDKTVDIIEGEIQKLLPECCQISLIRCPENLGTTISRNRGLAVARGDFIVICDSDTEFIDGSWRDLFNLIQRDKEIGVVAPALFYADGTIQNSVKKFPTLTDKLKKIQGILFNVKIENSDFYPDFPWETVCDVDTAISACWIIRRHAVDTIGLLDEKIFYSPEDLDYCLRMWSNGMRVVYYPALKLTHHTQQITHQKPFSRQSLSHFKGLFYYFIKHKYLFSRQRLYKRLCLKK